MQKTCKVFTMYETDMLQHTQDPASKVVKSVISNKDNIFKDLKGFKVQLIGNV